MMKYVSFNSIQDQLEPKCS